ncbi:hypothetical protein MTDSW087_00861 [Methylobacterium dankookense]|uniref:Uncharacterized protein n=2 Tax=Methylobacterium dankookense TaxID=560405 RepID=A0A564FTU0_9HYPH|nr:hypothetical protein IFDJLNFL_2608 [Methylobacterium dankookense]VUF11186.1 hypothetical protein MTDSW087_00861 [Methylobacterium dankookense]
MNDLVLDPSETRQPRRAAPGDAPMAAPAKGGVGRIALVAGLGLAGLGAFAGATSLMSSLVAPKPVSAVASRLKAADWPDLKDGLPSLAGTPSSTGTAQARFSLPPAEPPAAEPPAALAAVPEPLARGTADLKPAEIKPAAAAQISVPQAAPIQAAAPQVSTPAQAAARPAPPIENAPVIGPVRQASTLPPSRTAAVLPARAAETMRARTASTTFAALPPEHAAKPELPKADLPKPDLPKADPVKPEAAAPAVEQTAAPEAKPAARGEKPDAKPKAKPVQARKPAAAPTAVAAATAPEESDETEVFGIRMPTLSATGRKIGAGVEALGDAVKSLPDKF